ncbi:PASTA domain-containing protein [Nonomuraea candida]|uniref:PASTA domain-containing protein n=1 Tax=Nonomuraea candida TaxID=359159 RepID=UPI001B8015E1|nr:PASTA domain-containing protein [Nonomuraea candida]
MPKRPALAVLATAFLTACGAGTAPAAPVETVTATVQATPTPTPTPTASPDETDPPKREGSPSEAAEEKRLPNVVGMNLQEGQDTLQAAGFYVLNDKDATGQNRLQVLDRNWVVTKQTPPAGRKVSTDTLITLYAKKIGE